jgi:hypothetical protein
MRIRGPSSGSRAIGALGSDSAEVEHFLEKAGPNKSRRVRRQGSGRRCGRANARNVHEVGLHVSPRRVVDGHPEELRGDAHSWEPLPRRNLRLGRSSRNTSERSADGRLVLGASMGGGGVDSCALAARGGQRRPPTPAIKGSMCKKVRRLGRMNERRAYAALMPCAIAEQPATSRLFPLSRIGKISL